jgi:hypothetical protein
MFLVAAEFNFYSTRDHFVFGRDWQPTREDFRLGRKTAHSNVTFSFHGQN